MEKTEKNHQKIEKTVKEVLSEMLGIETTDINSGDLLTEDLHMGPTEITDLIEKLSQKGIIIEDNLFKDIETVEELIDYITNNADF